MRRRRRYVSKVDEECGQGGIGGRVEEKVSKEAEEKKVEVKETEGRRRR